MTKLNIRISPCPNDTFMFDAMLHGRVDTEGLEFEVRFDDIEHLNKALLQGKGAVSGESPDGGPHLSKASFAVVPAAADRYRILSSGAALGRGNGPVLVSADPGADLTDCSLRIAVPGLLTTANMLMERLYPHISTRIPYLFSEVAGAVETGECDAGVLIHEGRFTYRERGLHLLADLGVEWERRTGLPLPLGAILVSRSLPDEVQRTVGRVLRRSIEYGFLHPDESAGFVRSHAQELSDDVTRNHIESFVNGFSLSLGEEGRRAVSALLNMPRTDDLFA